MEVATIIMKLYLKIKEGLKQAMAKAIEGYSLSELMKLIESVLNENPTPIEGVSASYQFTIEGEEEGVYQLRINSGKALVKEQSEPPADCTLMMSLADFQKFLLGKLNGTMAFMTGKLKIKGDLSKAIKIESLLRQYDLKEHL
ncbi:SCP2 sterol-binding domain-containing protein [Neobacillus drentensis]|uniref:SCP2 sterol-binding domain-containing protein n=1 Tax=Neobacillus drentensis TaxID=220684 RepID=UPI0030009502